MSEKHLEILHYCIGFFNGIFGYTEIEPKKCIDIAIDNTYLRYYKKNKNELNEVLDFFKFLTNLNQLSN